MGPTATHSYSLNAHALQNHDTVTLLKHLPIVHPCGQYRKNSVISILEAEHKTGPLFPVHRLDRLVSGLLILARNSRTADFFRQEIEAGVVQKQYVAKVKGVFPAEEVELNAAVIYDPREGRSSVEVRARPAKEIAVEIESTLKGASKRTPESDAKSKESCTKFRRLSTDGVDSIVQCMPLTGRTHQIRVHLQYLGFPIANDDLYLHSNVTKRSKANTTADRAAKIPEVPETISEVKDSSIAVLSTVSVDVNYSDERLDSSNVTAPSVAVTNTKQGDNTREAEREKLQEHSKNAEIIDRRSSEDAENACSNGGDLLEPGVSLSIEANEVPELQKERSQFVSKSINPNFMVDPLCTHCPNMAPTGYTGDDEGLWLHCIRYSGSNWTYECPLPEWAL
ncbi:RNA pseudouridine synthase 7 [Physcomitrium patens]|uniref:RNA pseudouridine synthase 7 n=1 Tax=Physcomitrium patens TaxID=3218 RepID=UPI003CCCB755